MRCRHRRWRTITWSYTPPDPTTTKLETRDPEMYDVVRKVLFGFTSISQQCEECGMPRTMLVEGRWDGRGQP